MKRTACLLPCALLFFAVALPAHAAEDTLTDADLATLRGGFATAGGVTFDIGVTASAYVDGQLVLQNDLASLSAEGAQAAASISGEGGDTIIRQQLSGGLIGNVAANSASDRTIALHLDIAVVLPDFAATQGDLELSQLAARLNDDVGLALSSGN